MSQEAPYQPGRVEFPDPNRAVRATGRQPMALRMVRHGGHDTALCSRLDRPTLQTFERCRMGDERQGTERCGGLIGTDRGRQGTGTRCTQPRRREWRLLCRGDLDRKGGSSSASSLSICLRVGRVRSGCRWRRRRTRWRGLGLNLDRIICCAARDFDRLAVQEETISFDFDLAASRKQCDCRGTSRVRDVDRDLVPIGKDHRAGREILDRDNSIRRLVFEQHAGQQQDGTE